MTVFVVIVIKIIVYVSDTQKLEKQSCKTDKQYTAKNSGLLLLGCKLSIAWWRIVNKDRERNVQGAKWRNEQKS